MHSVIHASKHHTTKYFQNICMWALCTGEAAHGDSSITITEISDRYYGFWAPERLFSPLRPQMAHYLRFSLILINCIHFPLLFLSDTQSAVITNGSLKPKRNRHGAHLTHDWIGTFRIADCFSKGIEMMQNMYRFLLEMEFADETSNIYRPSPSLNKMDPLWNLTAQEFKR